MKQDDKFDVKMIDYIAFPEGVTASQLWKSAKKIARMHNCDDSVIAVYVDKKSVTNTLTQDETARVFPTSIAVFAENGGKGKVCGVCLNYPVDERKEEKRNP